MINQLWQEADQFVFNKILSDKGVFKMIQQLLKNAIESKDCCMKHRDLAQKFADSVILNSWCDVAELDLIRVKRKLLEEKKENLRLRCYKTRR